ncbi:MAG: PPOX class F420-dependent oxidoreductase [Rubrobacter sp.]|nr:PPOX class F420-dependent oxidoreductase [Rubrobacter sp.]
MKTLEPFVRQWATLLTTYRRDGTPVGTPVSIVVEGDHAYFRTWATSGKMKRIRNNPEVEVAPSTALGKQTGPAIWGRVRLLKGDEAAHAARLLSRKHPVMHRFLVPMAHRLRGYETVHLELIPLDNLAADGTKEGAA